MCYPVDPVLSLVELLEGAVGVVGVDISIDIKQTRFLTLYE
jgi:hypothetical protein